MFFFYYLGDGRNDSPGYTAQYCTYSLMENETGLVVSMAIIDKRQTSLKSVNMEKLGLIQCLDELEEKGMAVKELVTDAHLQIQAFMSKQLIFFYTQKYYQH